MTLREYIDKYHKNYTEFAEFIGVSPSTIYFIMSKKNRASYQVACLIEEKTKGLVPRSNWFPHGPSPKAIDIDASKFAFPQNAQIVNASIEFLEAITAYGEFVLKGDLNFLFKIEVTVIAPSHEPEKVRRISEGIDAAIKTARSICIPEDK